MDAILESLQATADQHQEELDEVRARVDRWRQYDKLIENFTIPVPEPPATVRANLPISANQICAWLMAMNADVRVKLDAEKAAKQAIVDANVRMEKETMTLNQWISANVKKYDRLLNRIKGERKFVTEMRQTITNF